MRTGACHRLSIERQPGDAFGAQRFHQQPVLALFDRGNNTVNVTVSVRATLMRNGSDAGSQVSIYDRFSLEPDHFKLQGKVDFEVGSFSKALGVQGGIVAGSEDTRNHALNHSRSWLLSGSQPPGVAAAQKAAIEVLT